MNKKMKIQHYVPKFYLKNFSTEKNTKYYLYCFDKSLYKVYFSNIKNIGCEKYFYDIYKDITQLIKKRNFESEFKEVYDKLIERRDLSSLTKKE